jgi:hypothetical protein
MNLDSFWIICCFRISCYLKNLKKYFIGFYIEGSFKFILNRVGVEESIVNAPLISLQSKNTNNAKSEVRLKQLIRDL